MEVLFKIGDSGGSRDGQIISAKPDGWLIPGTTMMAWIDIGKPPTMLAEMPRYQVDRLLRRINRLRWELSHTAAEIAAEFDGIDEEQAERDKALAVADRTRMITEGVDTNWGFADLKVHFALKIDSNDMHDYIEFCDREQDTDHKALITAKRRNKVDYSKLYDAAKLTVIADKEQRVDVDRSTAIAKTVVEPILSVEVTS